MKKKKRKSRRTGSHHIWLQATILIIILIAIAFVILLRISNDGGLLMPSVNSAAPQTAETPTTSATPEVAATPTPSPSPTPTPSPTPSPTPEPTPEVFTISAIGDLTLASHQNLSSESEYSYAGRMNGDYTYPFWNTIQYFNSDDLTIGNLECTFSDQALYSAQTFYFRSPSDWANILTMNSIDFVTTANNHTMDFGQTGIDDTCAALDAVGARYGTEDQAQVFTTDSGLTVGIFTAYNDYNPSVSMCEDAIAQMKEEGAEYIICMFHWGQELHYTPNDNQKNLAHACIDAGANLVYGTHPHCLEPVEEYNGGIILYSMGNFSFGGNTSPSDWDTAIVQVQVQRDLDGTISNLGWTAIPCRCSEDTTYNDYKPTPYEEGSEDYDRVMSKLLGTYEGYDRDPDYSSWYSSYSG